MRVPWKWIGLAGLAGVAATGAVVARRRRRAHREYDPDELRERLHRRLAEAREPGGPVPEPPAA
jgi:LPXTG-motif cell wall-anchored protein